MFLIHCRTEEKIHKKRGRDGRDKRDKWEGVLYTFCYYISLLIPNKKRTSKDKVLVNKQIRITQYSQINNNIYLDSYYSKDMLYEVDTAYNDVQEILDMMKWCTNFFITSPINYLKVIYINIY